MQKIFRLGKIDRGEAKEEKSRLTEPFERPDGGGASGSGGVPAVASNVGAAQAVSQEKEKDRSEKKKKPKDLDAGMGGDRVSAANSSSGADRASSGVPQARAQAGLSVNDFISKTKNQQRQGLKPSGPELIAYARYLGIDPVADHDLLWIAVEALEAPLPSDWTEHFDSNDRVFYYNATMRVSSWTHPLEHIYRETYKTIVNFRNSNLSMGERSEKLTSLQLEVKQMENDVHKEIAQWTEHTDEQGNRFYFNREERQSTWTDPRPAKCQILYLRMKMLRLLQSGSGATPGFAPESLKPESHLGGSRYGDLGAVGSGSHAERHASHGERHASHASHGWAHDDPALKRPKVGASSGSGFRARDGSDDARAEGGDGSGSLGTGLLPGTGTRGAPSGATGGGLSDSPGEYSDGPDRGAGAANSDSDSDNPKQRKKKKKKKKNKHDQGPPPATPPPRPGQGHAQATHTAAQASMKTSQSEPSVGGKPFTGGAACLGVDDGPSHGKGLSGPSPAGPQSLSHLGPLDHAGEGLSNVGRARPKAGIRLDPLGRLPGPDGGGEPKGAGPGVRNSASVPALQP